MKKGFTLVELSIVLVILGLLVGGVLAGQNLIAAAQMRAQLAQIEQYTQVTYQFREKYFALPGDLASDVATRLNFAARDGSDGSGDQDGTIEGHDGTVTRVGGGEAALFWRDLSDAGMIDGVFTTADGNAPPSTAVTSGINAYYPEAQIGTGYVVAWGGSKAPGNSFNVDGTLSLSVQEVLGIRTDGYLVNNSSSLQNASMTVEQAWNIDTKIDDGLPTRGKVVAQLVAYSTAPVYHNIGRYDDENNVATPVSANGCIDNGNVLAAEHNYTLSNGDSLHCSLSFRIK